METVEDLKELSALSGLGRDGACGSKCGCPLQNGLWITARKEIDTLALNFAKKNTGNRFLFPHSLQTHTDTLILA